jgi:hypothetical protein
MQAPPKADGGQTLMLNVGVVCAAVLAAPLALYVLLPVVALAPLVSTLVEPSEYLMVVEVTPLEVLVVSLTTVFDDDDDDDDAAPPALALLAALDLEEVDLEAEAPVMPEMAELIPLAREPIAPIDMDVAFER